MATIYPVKIPNRNTMYIEGTKSAIKAKLKSVGITKYEITNPTTKSKLGNTKTMKVKDIRPLKPKTSGLGKTSGGVNYQGSDKPSKASVGSKPPQSKVKTRGGGGKTTKVTTTTTNNLKADKNLRINTQTKTQTTKVSLNQKVSDLAKKVKARAPNVSMSKITDTIRTQIRKRPLTAVAGAGGVGIAIGAILAALKPTKVADATLTGNKAVTTRISKKDKGFRPKHRITKPSKTVKKVTVIIDAPLSKPKKDSSKKKTKVDKGSSGMMLSLIVGGKGTAAQRMKEINAEKTLEKRLGRRPSKKELIAHLKKK